MLGLENIVAGAKLRGVAGPSVVEVVRVEWIGSDALNVVYRGSSEGPAEVLLFREAEPRLARRAFNSDGDGEAFRVASEAQRIRLAHLFDPYLAVQQFIHRAVAAPDYRRVWRDAATPAAALLARRRANGRGGPA